MPAGGNDCDCHCGGTVCTKWFISGHNRGYGDSTPVGVLNNINDTGGGVGTNCGGGPADRIMHDSQYCRTKLEFAYDTDTFEMLVTATVPPHIDCLGGYAYGGGDVCKRRIKHSTYGTDHGGYVSAGLGAVMASKVIRLTAGQRVRARLVTDSVANLCNTQESLLNYVHTYSGNGNYWHTAEALSNPRRMSPRMLVCPADTSVWGEKACLLIGSQLTPKWYAAGVWPYDPPLAPWTYPIPGGGFVHPIDQSKPTAAYDMRAYNGKAKQCFMPVPGPLVPPEPHPTAPMADRNPASYEYLSRGSYAIVSGAHASTNLWVSPPGGPYSEDDKVQKDPGTQLNDPYRYHPLMPNWFAIKHAPFPLSRYFTESFFSSGYSLDSSDWHQQFWSNPDAFRAQIEPDPVEEGDPPAPPPTPVTHATHPRRCYQITVPITTRGWPLATYRVPAAPTIPTTPIPPTTITNHAWVETQRAAVEAHFENLTIHELTLPDYPVASTARPYIVETTTAPNYRLRYSPTFPTDRCGLDGAQVGCTNPGVCDIEMVVEIEKTGPWVFLFSDCSSPMTANGSTSVGSFVVEELAPKEDPGDPDVWVAVDLRTACKPNDTPDLEGWAMAGSEFSNTRPFADIALGGHLFTPWKRVDQGPKCKGKAWTDGGVSHLANAHPNWISIWEGNNSLSSIRNGATWTNWKNARLDMWGAVPQLVVHWYGYYYGRESVCCGYGELKWPLIHSGCHHNHNWRDTWFQEAAPRNGYGVRSANMASDTHPLGPRQWVLPW